MNTSCSLQIEDEGDAMIRFLREIEVLSIGSEELGWTMKYADNNIKAKGMSYLVEGMRRESFFLPRLRILDLTSMRKWLLFSCR